MHDSKALEAQQWASAAAFKSVKALQSFSAFLSASHAMHSNMMPSAMWRVPCFVFYPLSHLLLHFSAALHDIRFRTGAGYGPVTWWQDQGPLQSGRNVWECLVARIGRAQSV